MNAQAVTPAEIAQVLAAISQETAPEVLQLAYKLTTAAIWNHPGGEKTLEWEIASAIFGLTRSVVATAPGMTVDSIANGAITAFNQIGLLEDTRLIPELTECSRQLLRAVDIRGKIDKLVVTGLLNTLAKFDPQLLAKMVEEDLETNGQILPIANQQALVVAISHNQGYSSPLLDLMLAHPRVSEETKSRILQQRHL
ncbi:hypothetical protein [[Phormidium] sp. ETS-05]|uniref:hypothetical protein n=1 Tax=[Phormidium] sp. ETS-05 TaxID=222819 RepID=UPI001E3DE373|nr:hypothetical protein [[Phormidium] sp. ETS-05]